jgi:hypothetical protein
VEKENALLRQKIDALARKIYGVSSEKLDPGQLLLLLQVLDEPGAERSETNSAEGQPGGWSGSDIKSSRARGSGGSTALEGSIASALANPATPGTSPGH